MGSSNPRSLAQWYAETFGWKVHSHMTDTVTFRLGNVLLILVQDTTLAAQLSMWQVPAESTKVAITLACSSVGEVDSLYHRLQDRPACILSEPTSDSAVGYGFGFCDPEGNAWEFTHLTEDMQLTSGQAEVIKQC